MGKKQRQWAKRAYEKLILELGGKCTECSTTEDLSIDHIDGKDWVANKVEWSQRISVYRREKKEGKLQVLCGLCNSRKGNPRRPRRRKPPNQSSGPPEPSGYEDIGAAAASQTERNP